MKKVATLALLVLAALAEPALATPTTVGDFRGTVQTVTTTGTQTISLGADTTIVRFNASSQADVIGITGGSDGRMVFFWNIGSGNVLVYNEHASATASDRLIMDAYGGYRTLWNGGVGLGVAIYDGTSSRWRFATWEGINTSGPTITNGNLSTAASLSVYTDATIGGTLYSGNATTVGTGSSTRLTLRSGTSGNNGSTVRFQNSSSSNLWSLGPDWSGNGGQNFWLYDNVNSKTPLYLDQSTTGTSYLSMGSSSGGIQYDDSHDQLALFVNGQIRFRLGGQYDASAGAGSTWTLNNSAPFYTREASGTAKPTLSSNCNGSGTASQNNDSSDARGSITLGTGASACTMTFTVPWDINQSPAKGVPICTANSTTSGVSIAVTSMSDHAVTFTPSSSGSTTIYYHCDGIIAPL